MDFLKRLDPLWIALLIIGGLNWAVLALFDTNIVSEIFGTGTVTDVIYVLVGLAALMLVPQLHRRHAPEGTHHAPARRLAQANADHPRAPRRARPRAPRSRSGPCRCRRASRPLSSS